MMTPLRPRSLWSMPTRHPECHLIAFAPPAHDGSLEENRRLLGVQISCSAGAAPQSKYFRPRIEFGVFLSPELSERGDGWPVQGCTVHGEMRTVARAIPTHFERVPVDVASEMSASGGMQMKRTAFVPICSDLFQAVPHDRATSGFQLINRFQLARSQVLGEVFYCSQILTDEAIRRHYRLPSRIVNLSPRVPAVHNKSREKQASDHAVRNTLPGVAGVDINPVATRIAAREGSEVHRV